MEKAQVQRFAKQEGDEEYLNGAMLNVPTAEDPRLTVDGERYDVIIRGVSLKFGKESQLLLHSGVRILLVDGVLLLRDEG